MLLEIKVLPRKNPTGRGKHPQVMVLKCDVCGGVYERSYSKHHFEEKVHRCSTKCVYGSRSSDGIGGHCAIVRRDHCAECCELIERREYQDSDHVFCDRRCYGDWKSKQPETKERFLQQMGRPDVRARAIETRARRIAAGEIRHGRLGKHHSEETKQRLREIHGGDKHVGKRNGMWGRHHTKQAREAMSEKHADLLVKGLIRPYGGNSQKGTHLTKDGRSFFYKSGWELALMKWLDTNPDVVSWDYECIRIPYYYDDHKRWYVPDFIVTLQNGHREMWEVKPKEFVGTEKNVLKEISGREWCQANNVSNFCVLTGDDLRHRGII